MSALGQKQTWRLDVAMSALPPKADMVEHRCDVRYVPEADFVNGVTCLAFSRLSRT
jgi:hypothetical protein